MEARQLISILTLNRAFEKKENPNTDSQKPGVGGFQTVSSMEVPYWKTSY